MKLRDLIFFAAGIAVGALSIYQYAEKKFEGRYQEDMNSFKETQSKKKAQENGEVKKAMDIQSYKETIKKNSYQEESSDEEFKEVPTKEKKKRVRKPYVVDYETYNDPEFDEFEKIGLIYYSNGILTDDMNRVVEDVEETAGTDFMNHFGEGDDPDTVYVRNEKRKADFEIVQDEAAYSTSPEDD